jgi:hypothetical protein
MYMKLSVKFLIGVCLLFVLAGCSGNKKFVYNQDAMQKTKTVAVLIYAAPPTIEYRSDPTKIEEDSFLQSLVKAATADNGGKAATLAQESFIQTINSSGFVFKVLTRNEMMNNAAYQKVANKYYALTQVVEEKPEQSALEMAGDIFGFGKKEVPTSLPSVGAEGQPAYGLVLDWNTAPSALIGTPEEAAYIKESIQALGVDAALVINDWGYAFSCDACMGGTGTGSSSTAFLASLVNANGDVIMNMREWFVTTPTTAPMVGYIINPFQHESLFKGHGTRMATVLMEYYKESTAK